MAYMLRNKSINIMVSRSSDGEIISRIASRLGAVPVRGSTKKRGGEALVRMIRRVKGGEDAAITPDGPQGPLYRAHPGGVYLAAKTGRPLVPAAFSSSRKIILNSWDRFMIPIPFSRAVMVYDRPVYVSEKDSMDDKKLEFEERLNETTAFADGYFNTSCTGDKQPNGE